MRMYIDVETIPSQAPGEVDRIRATLKPPGTLKRAESIAAWWQDEAPAAAEAEWRKQALDPAAGELIAIGCAVDNDDDPRVFIRGPGESEAQLLGDFYAHVIRLTQDDVLTDAGGRSLFAPEPFLVGHNVAFDIGFLRARSWVHNIRPPFKLPAADAWPGKTYACTMNTWSGRTGKISLDRLCRALNIPSRKDDNNNGSTVFDRWIAGDLDSLATYCAADVAAVRTIWHRLCWESAA